MYGRWNRLIVLFVVAAILAACGAPGAGTTPEAAETPQTEQTEPVVTETVAETPALAGPTEVRIVTVHISSVDAGWDRSFIDSITTVADQHPHGLTVTHEVVENVPWADAERVMNDLANTGLYDIIFQAGGLRDATCVSAYSHPDQLFGITTNPDGYECYTAGANLYLYNSSSVGECGYLLGALAGLMTTSNTLGVVAGYPASDTNEPINAFIDGSRAVNPEAQTRVTFIQSWYDPPLARDAAESQINAGADFIWGLVDGTFEAASAGNALAAGIYVDQNYLAPETVAASVVANWDSYFLDIIDVWWEHAVNGTAYSSTEEAISFTLAEGSCDIAITDGLVPANIATQVMDLRQQIIDGTLVVPISSEEPVSR